MKANPDKPTGINFNQPKIGYRRIIDHARKEIMFVVANMKNNHLEENDFVLPVFELVYIMQGSGIYVNKQKKAFSIKPGDAFLRFPDVKHSVFLKGPVFRCIISIPSKIHDVMRSTHLIAPKQPVIHPGLSAYIQNRFMSLIQEVNKDLSSRLMNSVLHCSEFITDILHMSNQHLDEYSNEYIIRNARSLLDRDPFIHMSLEEIATSLNIGYHSFRKKFKEHIGISAAEYRMQRKMDHAMNLLLNTNSKIADIAGILGYSDFSVFSRQYKKITGQTPSEFRLNK